MQILYRVGLVVTFCCAYVATVVAQEQQVAQKPKVSEIRDWGTATDQDGDCIILQSEGKLTIKVPGTIHDMYPGQRDPAKRFNAPRVLQSIEGDFVAEVKVTSEWKPGPRNPDATTRPYFGAGLIVWNSGGELVRLERNVWNEDRGLPANLKNGLLETSYTSPLYYKDAKSMGRLKTATNGFFKGQTTWLRLKRIGESIETAISTDGKEWVANETISTTFEKTVLVGVHAINSSTSEFVVEFENLKISKN